MEKVGLAESRVSIEEEGVVRVTRVLGNRERGAVREAIRVAHDELVKAVTRVEMGGRCAGKRGIERLLRGWTGRLRLWLGGYGDACRWAEDRADAAFQYAAEPFLDPRLSIARSSKDEHRAIPVLRLKRLQPDLVGGLADSVAKSGADVAPGGDQLRSCAGSSKRLLGGSR